MDFVAYYQYLSDLVKSNPDKYKLTGEMCSGVTNGIDIPIEHLEIIYAIIFYYDITNKAGRKFSNLDILIGYLVKERVSEKNKTRTLSYKGKTSNIGTGAIYDVDNLPSMLQQLISAYITEISK